MLFLITQKKVNFVARYNQTLEITDKKIIYTYDSGLGRKKETITVEIDIVMLAGIEYFTKTREFAFLAPVTYDNGYTDFGIPVENAFSGNPIPYLNQNVMKVKKIHKGNFSEKWRNG